MPRFRFLRALGLVAGIAAVLYGLVSLFLPSSRQLILGVDKRSGKVRMVRNNVTFLPPHQFYRLQFEKREGFAQRDGLINIISKDGVPVTISYRLRFGVAGQQLPDARTLVRAGFSAWIRKRVGEAVSAVTQQVPIEELMSPGSTFNAQRSALRHTVARHLAQSGLQVTAFEIARMEVDREALLRIKRAEVRRGARGVAGRVAIFAIDGADWELLTELLYDDRLPNIEALIKGGTTASVSTIQPTVSPMLWTSVATGLTPDRHGVIDFVERTTGAPVDAYSRRAPALWEISEAFGRPAVVVNWWTAWPPTSRGPTIFDAPVEYLDGAIYPPELAGKARSLEIGVDTVNYEHVRRFLNITRSEYEKARGGDAAHPINLFRRTLAKTWSDHRVGVQLYREKRPILTMVSYEGTDLANHLFGPYHPPYRQGIGEENYRRYWPSVANYYAEIDRLIGEWMHVLTDDTTVILMSAHGFRWGKNRPRVQPNGRSALSDHRSSGVFIAYGNHVLPSRGNHTISLYDIAPAVLALLGLPSSTDMPGKFPAWPFRDITPVESVRVVSYSEFFAGRPLAMKRLNKIAYHRHLQAQGHLADPNRAMSPIVEDEVQSAAAPIAPEKWGRYAYLNNTGIELRRQGKTREAVEAFQGAINVIDTRPAPFLNMAMTLLDRQQYTVAEDVFINGVNRGLPNADRWFADFAAYYRERNMTSRAINILYKGKQLFPQSYLIAANLGSALAQAERYTEGLPELERALGLQPSSTLALNNLATFYARQKDYGRALDYWNRSLSIDPRQPETRKASEAVRTRL